MKTIYILSGTAFTYMDNHLALDDKNAQQLEILFKEELKEKRLENQYQVKLLLLDIADCDNSSMTEEKISHYLDQLVAQNDTKAIILNSTTDNNFIGKIRKVRKDIFTVGFKTTINQIAEIQYMQSLELLKKNSLNLVIASDIITNNSMIIAPEETKYAQATDILQTLDYLVKMTVSRMQNHFTRSTVIEGQAVDWNSILVPENLRTVVNHCIEQGAYKPFLGKTAGHFAVKVNAGEILTSIRKTNFNDLEKVGLVKVESKNDTEVIAHGFRPSVGGQSQRIIFNDHPDLDCIVHFHCPVKEDFRDTVVPVKDQWPNECGSHECGKNTSNGLKEVDIGDGDRLKVVYLDDHGPNIVFNRNTPANKVISFINQHFDLSHKTGGLVQH